MIDPHQIRESGFPIEHVCKRVCHEEIEHRDERVQESRLSVDDNETYWEIELHEDRAM